MSSDRAKLRNDILIAGTVSGLFYGSALFAFVYLIPVQNLYGRRGRKAGLLGSALAVLIAAVCQIVRGLVTVQKTAWSGLFAGPALLAFALPPCFFLALLALMNLRFWDSKPAPARSFSVSILASLLLIPALAALEGDAGIRAYIEGYLAQLSSALKGPMAEGYDSSVLKAMLDPKAMLDSTYQVLNSCYAALILAFMAGSWWLGQRMAQKSAVRGSAAAQAAAAGPEDGPAKPLEELRLPEYFVWPLIASWAAVLGLVYLKTGDPYEAAAWNLALVFTCAYTAQGLGLFSFFLKRWNTPGWVKTCAAIALVLAIATPPFGTALALVFPILGVTEIWIPYRKLKGVGA